MLSGLRGKAQSHSDGVDWESFYYVCSHLPTLCTLSTRRNTMTDGSASAVQVSNPHRLLTILTSSSS